MIEDNEDLPLKSALTIYEAMSSYFKGHYQTGLLHGSLKYEEKNAVMQDFKDNKIQIFRPDQNAKRINNSCRRVLMPEIPEEKFIDACIQVVRANEHFVPPYGKGATLYIRPYVIGVGDNIGVKPAPEYIFGVFCIPVGAYFKNGMTPVNFIVSDYDRAAPWGTGDVKVGGNYAASLRSHEMAVKQGFADCIYLDPATHSKIEIGRASCRERVSSPV